MMLIVSDIVGLPGLPSTKFGIRQWLKRLAVPLVRDGNRFTFALSDLPAPVRAAFLDREAAEFGLDPGQYDEAAHARLEDATPRMRARAEADARLVTFIEARVQAGLSQEDAFKAARAKFGPKGTSRATLLRNMKAVKGVDPVNFAPALLTDHCRVGGRKGPAAGESPEAWAYFLHRISAAHPDWPLAAAYDEVERIKAQMGWHWPSRATIYNRWNALPQSAQLTLRFGAEKAAEMLRQPVPRKRDEVPPMHIWSLDGQTRNVNAGFEDGTEGRPIELRLVDVGSGRIVGWRLCNTENAIDTAALIIEAVRKYGAPKFICTDNSRAFSSHLIAGGTKFKFRKRKDAPRRMEPPGVCQLLGIDVFYHKPRNGQAKYVERTFAETQRRVDAGPEFKGAHTGASVLSKPDGPIKAVPLATIVEVSEREYRHHNARIRRGGFAKGRSFDAIFEAGTKDAPLRMPTERQFYRASLAYRPVSVDRNGRFEVEGWIYGGPDTQDALLAWHGKGQVLVGINPHDFEAPAVAYDPDGRLIADDIEAVVPGEYRSMKGLQAYKRHEKAAQREIRKAKAHNALAGAALLEKARQAQAAATPTEPDRPRSKVVQPPFGGPLIDTPRRPESAILPRHREAFAEFVGRPKGTAG